MKLSRTFASVLLACSLMACSNSNKPTPKDPADQPPVMEADAGTEPVDPTDPTEPAPDPDPATPDTTDAVDE